MMGKDSKLKNRFSAYATEITGFALGFQILVSALDRLDEFQIHPFQVSFLIIAAVFVIAGTFLHKKLKPYVKNIDVFFQITEGIVSVLSAILMFEEGKSRIPYFIFFIGLVLILLGIIRLKINQGNWHLYGKKVIKYIGLAFLIFGSGAIIINTIRDKNGWVYFTSGLFLFMGVLYFVFNNWVFEKISKMDQTTGT